ncbi:MAG: hypothetical protein GF410_07340 [Chitinivibrionales bacterium]|nr:hypothetical protein [Chitinivibrionales bacterium]
MGRDASFVAALSLWLASCAPHDSPSSAAPSASLSYTVRIPAMHEDSVSVALVADNPGKSGMRFLLPFVYSDNPVDSLAGPLVRGLVITDSTGAEITVDTSGRMVGPSRTQELTIPSGAAFPVTISYRVDLDVIFSDSVNGPLSLVFLNGQSGFLPGSHLFMVPAEPSLADIWRTPRTITLSLDLGKTVSAVGVPGNNQIYRNAYELLFVQIALGPELLAQGSGGGQSFAMYGLDNDGQSSAGRLAQARESFSVILDNLVPVWGLLAHDTYPVVYHRTAGGREGAHSFILKYPHQDHDSTLSMVLAHEAIHHVLGVRAGDWDDPWWKEGTTYYLGFTVTSRLGLIPKTKVRELFTRQQIFNETEKALAPSDAYVRCHLYTGRLYNVVYHKGSQIAMLMDYLVRRATGNSVSLDKATASLCARYDGSAFTRNQFIKHFRTYNGCDISPILKRFADRPGNIPDAILTDVFSKLDTLGAFGDIHQL